MSENSLRVIDFGSVSPLRSQTLWHAVAHGVSAGAPPTLSFMRPDSPYVSIGFHHRWDEVDHEFCRRVGLPVYRRMVGGGPVYLDDAQLFFQITVPLSDVPAVRSEAVRAMLTPAVEAFRDTGVAAELEESGDVVVGHQKICGHGAGQIERAVVVVGNLIGRFDHGAATRILNTPDPETRDELEALMRRYVVATPVDEDAFTAAAAHRYAAALGLRPQPGVLNDLERKSLADLDGTFVEDDWLRGSNRSNHGSAPTPPWRVKVKAGVFLVKAEGAGSHTRVSVADGRILRATVTDPHLDGAAATVQQSLEGLTLGEGRALLAGLGHDGLAALFDDVEQAIAR